MCQRNIALVGCNFFNQQKQFKQMNINSETQKAIDKVIEEQLPEMLRNKTAKMIEDIVSDIFRWGDVRKQIKEKIEASINVNLQKFDLVDYNAIIAKTINENLLEQVNLKPILDMTQDILSFVDKKEISLEAIAEMFIEASKEENEMEGEGEITFIVEESERYFSVYADIEPDKEKHECSIQFSFSIKDSMDGKIFIFRTKESYYDNKKRDISPSRMVNMGAIEAKIFRLYSAQVKITNYNEIPSINWDRY